MILTELGFTGSGNVLKNIIQRPSGQLQVLVNDNWINLNMCSPYLPSEVSPYIVASDWGGYTHSTTGVETITVTGDTTCDVGQVVTYTATMTGDNLAGVVLKWYKYEAGSWSTVLTTGSSLTVTWVDPRNAIIKVTATNICNFNTVTKEVNISYNCVPVTTGGPWLVGTKEVNIPFDVYVYDFTNNTLIDWQVLGRTFTWYTTGPVTLVSGQGTNKVTLLPTGAYLCNVKVIITSCGNTYDTGWLDFTPVTAAPPTYYNTQQSRVVQKQCPSGQVGSYITVYRAAGTHSSNISQADADAQAVSWLNGTDAQQVANNDPSGNCGSTPSWYNEAQTKNYTKQCSIGEVGTSVAFTVPANTFRSDISQVHANQLAIDYMDGGTGQTNANNLGQCIGGGGCPTITGLTMNVTSTTGGAIGGTWTVTVNQAGYYNYNLGYGSNTHAVAGSIYLNIGSNTNSFSMNSGAGTYSISVTLIKDCGQATFTSLSTGTPYYTVTGSVACQTYSDLRISGTKSIYINGTVTVAINANPNSQLTNGYGNVTFNGVNYPFSGADFSSGITFYFSFNVPAGSHIFGYPSVTINDANACSSATATSGSQIEVISPS